MKCNKCGRDTWVGVETGLCDDCKLPKSSATPNSRNTMTTEQIKQTIAEIALYDLSYGHTSSGFEAGMEKSSNGEYVKYSAFLEITDYLQKTIEEKDDAIRRHVNSANFLSNEISEWSATAEAQAAEIERLKGQLKFHMQKHAGDGL